MAHLVSTSALAGVRAVSRLPGAAVAGLALALVPENGAVYI